jgi:hypothetical protein
MNIIFKLISFPIKLIIGIISMLFVVALNHEEIKRVRDKKLTKGELIKKLYSDIDHFLFYEGWVKIFPVCRALIALIIYYLISVYFNCNPF